MIYRLTFSFALALTICQAVVAEEPITESISQTTSESLVESPDTGAHSFFKKDTLTHNWFQLGKSLEEQGISFSLSATQVYQINLTGGQSAHRHAGRYSGRYDLEMELDLEKLLSLPGGRMYAQVRGGWSDGLSDSSVGDLFGVNAVAVGDRSIDLWQLYYEQSFFNDTLLVRAGKIDLTGGFERADWPGSFDGNAYANDEAAQFLNGALVNNPTIPFPDPGLAVSVHVELTDGVYLSAAIADADADVRETGFNTAFHGDDNAFVIVEAGWMPKFHSAHGELPGGYRAGFWYDPQSKEKFDGSGDKRDDVGFYLSFDQMIYKETADEDDTQGAGLFARYGYSHGDVNEIRCFWSIGGQYQGLIPTRDNDVLGFGVAQGRLSPDAGFTESHETAYELYYSIEVAPWLILTPSAQYIQNPGGDATIDDAFVAGFRAHITF